MASATTSRASPALRRALHADRAAHPLGARERVLRPARLRARALPAVALGGGRQAAADQGHPLLDGHLLGGRDPADRRCSATGAQLAQTAREIDLFDRDDGRFLAGDTHRPQGRFNAGQKVNAILTAAFATLFFVSGLLLWYGERDTRFRLAGTVYLHDTLMYISVVIVVGHLYLSLIHPTTRHALRGMTLGTVREDWARKHHSKWTTPPRSGRNR